MDVEVRVLQVGQPVDSEQVVVVVGLSLTARQEQAGMALLAS